MSDEDRRNAVVSLAVYPETKEAWESAATDDPNADSLSQLIRVAVNRYLTDEQGGTQGELPQEVHEQLTDLNSQQKRLSQHLDEMKGQLADIREAVVGSSVGPETEALADDIFEILPSKMDLETNSVFPDDHNTGRVPPPEPGSIEWLADQFDVPRYQIQTALDHLQETTYAVQRTDDGEYYKEV